MALALSHYCATVAVAGEARSCPRANTTTHLGLAHPEGGGDLALLVRMGQHQACGGTHNNTNHNNTAPHYLGLPRDQDRNRAGQAAAAADAGRRLQVSG